MSLVALPPLWTLTLNVSGWIAVHMGISYLLFSMPDSWFDQGTGGAAAAASRERRFYEKVLRIKSWKDRLPEAGAVFKGGFSKKRLNASASDHNYRRKFTLETRRGEWTHWLCMLPAPLFFLWNEPVSGWIMIAYALAANLPFIAILRYNRLRLARIDRPRTRKE